MADKKKKGGVEFKSLYMSNIAKALKYYFKNILYILVANAIAVAIYRNFIRAPYLNLVVGWFGVGTDITYIFFYTTLFSLLTIPKVILYGNTVQVMKKKAKNDVIELVSLVFSRFLSVLGTLLIYYVLVLLLTLLGIIPGFIFAFYYFFGIYLTAVGDPNNKKAEDKMGGIQVPSGPAALDRSKNLLRGNLLKFMLMTIIIILITFAISEGFTFLIIENKWKFSGFVRALIRLSIWDIFYIYGAFMFIKLELLEKEVLDEEEEKVKADQEKLNKAAVNKFKGPK